MYRVIKINAASPIEMESRLNQLRDKDDLELVWEALCFNLSFVKSLPVGGRLFAIRNLHLARFVL
jgi:hypothetical protein